MYYQKEIKAVVDEFGTNPNTGLSFEEVARKLKRYGPNSLPIPQPPSLILKFLNQFKSVLIIILLAAALLSGILGDILDATVIFAIIILNATIGTFQEIKADKVLTSLKNKDIPHTLALRESQTEKILTLEVVPGDILILEEGEKVPADGRIIESFALNVDESILTGESQTVLKQSRPLAEKNIPLGDQTNMIFRDTRIISGRGKAVVTATGVYAEIGKISQFLEEEKEEKSPLTIELDHVGKMLTIGILIITFAIFVLTGLRNISLLDRILISVSLAVAAIPEGLPAIATITLALGVERLAGKKTIVKNLNAIESLGSLKIIATDKTGTLTENKINVTDISTDRSNYKVTGDAYEVSGTFLNQSGHVIDPLDYPDLYKLLRCAVLANNSTLKKIDGSFDIIGDTTEGALKIAAERAKISTDRLESQNSRLFELPFSQERRMMSVVEKDEETGDVFLYTKGAPEEVLRNCKTDDKKAKRILKDVDGLAQMGLRTLAFASKNLSKDELRSLLEDDLLREDNLEFLGIIGAKDTLRPEIRESIQKAEIAGIKTIMITGDHLSTAASVGIESGIIKERSQSISEKDIEDLSRRQIANLIAKDKYRVFARISPLGKLKLIEAIKLLPQSRVGVTGDGVNDAPALKAAQVGIAMGSGTDIAREVSDLVITDDNYSTIIEAVKEGRIIFANLIKFIRYLISCNLAEVFVVSFAIFIATPLPLLPIQLLWINLITDGLPAIALGSDPPEYDIMLYPLKSYQYTLLHKRRWSFMIAEGLVIGFSIFLLYLFSLVVFNQTTAQTIAFSSLAIAQLVHALNNRSTRKSIRELGIFTNIFLIWSVILSLLFQIATVQTNFGHLFFKTVSLNLTQWLLVLSVSIIPFIFVEIKKFGLKKLKI